MMTTTTHECPFTLSEYRALIQLAKQRFTFCDLHDFDGPNRILWRHDLEYSLREMDRIAQIDADERVRTVIYAQLRSPFYNAFSNYARRLLLDWISKGLTVGLHFDWEFFAGDLSRLEAHLRAEKARLEDLIGVPVTSFSYHNPNPEMLGHGGHMAGMLNAYGPGFFNTEGVNYISDSNGRWRSRNLREVLSDPAVTRLQVNLHDTWWCDDRIPQILKVENAFRADAEWKIKFYRDHAHIIVDKVL